MSIGMFANELVGKECTTVTGGAGTGSVIGFGFGRRLRRIKPLKNPMLNEVDRSYASELELTVYCAWRLRNGTDVLCGWRDSADERTWKLLQGLIGRAVESVTVETGANDLAVTFAGDLTLDVFCDITADHESEDNYTFSTEDAIESVGVKSVLVGPSLRRRTLQVIGD